MCPTIVYGLGGDLERWKRVICFTWTLLSRRITTSLDKKRSLSMSDARLVALGLAACGGTMDFEGELEKLALATVP